MAAMVVPQGMSYAQNLAFLPQVYGLVSAWRGIDAAWGTDQMGYEAASTIAQHQFADLRPDGGSSPLCVGVWVARQMHGGASMPSAS